MDISPHSSGGGGRKFRLPPPQNKKLSPQRKSPPPGIDWLGGGRGNTFPPDICSVPPQTISLSIQMPSPTGGGTDQKLSYLLPHVGGLTSDFPSPPELWGDVNLHTPHRWGDRQKTFPPDLRLAGGHFSKTPPPQTLAGGGTKTRLPPPPPLWGGGNVHLCSK